MIMFCLKITTVCNKVLKNHRGQLISRNPPVKVRKNMQRISIKNFKRLQRKKLNTEEMQVATLP